MTLRYTLASVRLASPPELDELRPGDTMSEILTESFCERCGTRYTFETESPRAGRRFGKLKVLSRGLKNYVLSDEASLDEALADARSDEDRQASGQQLDAFHKTFNFCMSCRQYTCANCWNEVESRCLSCAPHLGHEVLEAPFRAPDPFGRIASIGAAAAGNGHEIDLETLLQGSSAEAAWPTTDLSRTPPAEEAVKDEETDAVSRLQSLFAIATRPDEQVGDVVQSPPVKGGPDLPVAAAPAEPPPVEAAPVPPAAESPAAEVVKPPAPTVVQEPPTAVAPAAVAGPPAGTVAAKPAPRAPIPPKPAKPARDIALEVSLFEEDAAHAGAEAALAAREQPAVPASAQPPADDTAVAGTPPSELDAIDERTAAALAQTAEFLTRFNRTTGSRPAAAAESKPVEPSEPVQPPPVAAERAQPSEPAQPPVAAEPARPQVDRIEVPTWHVETPPAPAGQPNGHPAEPVIVPTSPGPALQPSVQARWPAPVAPSAPPAPVPPPAIPAAAVQPPALPQAALPVASPPATEPEWPLTPAWPASQPSAAPSWPAGEQRGGRVSAVDAIWAASSRDVLSRPESGVQSCVNCGLPLSATARFCRRCGANQVPA